MHYEKMKKLLKLRVKPKADRACRFLERRGIRFCVDYGYNNAIEVAKKLRWKKLHEPMEGMIQ